MFLPIDHIVTKTEKRVYIEMGHVVQKSTLPICRGPISAQKLCANFTKGCIFPPSAQNGLSLFPPFIYTK